MIDQGLAASFWEHTEELRKILLKVFIVIALGFLVAFGFYREILQYLAIPLQEKTLENPLKHYEIKHERLVNTNQSAVVYFLPSNSKEIYRSSGVKNQGQNPNQNGLLVPPGEFLDLEQTIPLPSLYALGPMEGMQSALKVSFWVGLVGTSPIWIYFLLQFIIPALHAHEKHLIFPFFASSFLLISLGFLFAFSVTIPLANRYLKTFNHSLGINLWSMSQYFDYTFLLLLATGLVFELFVVLMFFVHYGFLSAQKMGDMRRTMIVLAFVLGALLTPPDILSQVMIALPLAVLYEIAILYARMCQKKK